MSFGERCQLFQHFKFLCQVRIFSSNYIVAGQSWENIGFDSEDIANIMQMQRKDDSYYASLNTDIARLSVETKALENAIAGQGYIQSYAQNGNPPATPQEQNERMQYVTQVALERYGNTYNTADFNKYVLYLYMSHYIDNPNYTKESPGFDNIYAYVKMQGLC